MRRPLRRYRIHASARRCDCAVRLCCWCSCLPACLPAGAWRAARLGACEAGTGERRWRRGQMRLSARRPWCGLVWGNGGDEQRGGGGGGCCAFPAAPPGDTIPAPRRRRRRRAATGLPRPRLPAWLASLPADRRRPGRHSSPVCCRCRRRGRAACRMLPASWCHSSRPISVCRPACGCWGRLALAEPAGKGHETRAPRLDSPRLCRQLVQDARPAAAPLSGFGVTMVYAAHNLAKAACWQRLWAPSRNNLEVSATASMHPSIRPPCVAPRLLPPWPLLTYTLASRMWPAAARVRRCWGGRYGHRMPGAARSEIWAATFCPSPTSPSTS